MQDIALAASAVTHRHLDKLKADTFRQYGAFSWRLLLTGALFRRTFRPIVTLRLCQACAAGTRWLLPICKLLHKIATHRAAIDLPWRTSAGPGLIITHGWGLVVNEGVKIGSNVTLFHGVTLGQRDRVSADGHRSTACPSLGDEVWMGPHAIVVGGVTIGDGSRIAGGTFVVEDVPPRCIVSGNPAKIIKTNCMPDVVNPWRAL